MITYQPQHDDAAIATSTAPPQTPRTSQAHKRGSGCFFVADVVRHSRHQVLVGSHVLGVGAVAGKAPYSLHKHCHSIAHSQCRFAVAASEGCPSCNDNACSVMPKHATFANPKVAALQVGCGLCVSRAITISTKPKKPQLVPATSCLQGWRQWQ